LSQYFKIFCIFNNSFLKVFSFGIFNQSPNLVPINGVASPKIWGGQKIGGPKCLILGE